MLYLYRHSTKRGAWDNTCPMCQEQMWIFNVTKIFLWYTGPSKFRYLSEKLRLKACWKLFVSLAQPKLFLTAPLWHNKYQNNHRPFAYTKMKCNKIRSYITNIQLNLLAEVNKSNNNTLWDICNNKFQTYKTFHSQ